MVFAAVVLVRMAMGILGALQWQLDHRDEDTGSVSIEPPVIRRTTAVDVPAPVRPAAAVVETVSLSAPPPLVEITARGGAEKAIRRAAPNNPPQPRAHVVRNGAWPGASPERVSSPSAAPAAEDFDRRLAYYWCDFENPRDPLSEWNTNRRVSSRRPTVRTLLGSFEVDHQVSLRLSDLPAHGAVRLCVDLFTFGDWRGRARFEGPGLIRIQVPDGPRLLYSSFTGHNTGMQSYPMPYCTGLMRGFTGGKWMRTMSLPGRNTEDYTGHYPVVLTFRHDSPDLAVVFNSAGPGAKVWAMDNVGVQLLDRFPEVELSAAELQQCIAQLGQYNAYSAWEAMKRLSACGDKAVEALVEALGWELPGPEDMEALAVLMQVFEHDDYKQWEEALQVARELGPFAETACRTQIDRRCARGDAPNWARQIMGPDAEEVPRDLRTLRYLRAVWVLEQIWTPRSRALLGFGVPKRNEAP